MVLQSLASPAGRGADELAELLDIGRATVFEILRALRDVDAVRRTPEGKWTLNTDTPLGSAITGLLDALAPLDGRELDRPPRARDR